MQTEQRHKEEGEEGEIDLEPGIVIVGDESGGGGGRNVREPPPSPPAPIQQPAPAHRYRRERTFDRYFLIVGILTLVIAFTCGKDSCQGDDIISLQAWLITVVFSMMFVRGFFRWRIELLRRHERSGWTYEIVIHLLQLFYWFTFAWWIIGIATTIRSHSKCVDDGKSLGVITVVNLIYVGGVVLCLCPRYP
jgi:hypothetical protein